jgi:hypothetical protein
MPNPDITLHRAPMGGLWALPHTLTGHDAGEAVMYEPAAPIPPLQGAPGWILEPAQAVDIVNAMIAQGAAVATVGGRILTAPLAA